jgi:hemolysin activation/secretion protein
VNSAPLTVTANAASRLYGAANPAFSAQYSGFVNGDTAETVYLATSESPYPNVQLISPATVESTVGTYQIIPSGFNQRNPFNYTISYVPGTLTINPATLTYTANSYSRTYGAANPAFGGSVSGFVAGDTLAGATFGKLVFNSTATTASNAGINYAINGSGLSAKNGNYVFAQAPTNATALAVDRAPLTVTADAASRSYGSYGTANPPFSAQYSGFVNGDTAAIIRFLQLTTSATAAAPVGTYQIVPAIADTVRNYTISYVPGLLTVTPVPLTITAPDASRHYGSPNVFGGDVQYSGFVNGDSLASIYLPTPSSLTPVQLSSHATAGSPVGAYAITPSGFNLKQPSNYSITYAPGTLSVTRVPYTITAPDLMALVGAVPAKVAVNTPALPSFGPQFAVYASSALMPTGNFWNDASTPTYVLLPTIVPAANTTLGDIYHSAAGIDRWRGAAVVRRARLDGELKIEGAHWFSEESYRAALPIAASAEIDGAALQAGVEHLNRNPYRRVALAAEAGDKTGSTRLVLRAKEERPWQFIAGANNTGTAITGWNRVTAGVNWGNAFGRGDMLGYNYSADPEFKYSSSHSLNYGTDLASGKSLTLFGSASQTESALPSPLTQKGSSFQVGARYGILLEKIASGWERNLALAADFKYSDNNLNFATIPITNNVMEIVQFGAIWSQRREGTALSASLYGSPGKLAAHNDDASFDVARAGAKAAYVYGRLDGQYSQSLPLSFTWTINASAQAASGPLLGTEQMAGGGSTAVRGYPASSAFGDEGGLVNMELYLPTASPFAVGDQLQTFVFSDGAWLHNQGLNGGAVKLSSVGLGMNYRIGRGFSLAGSYGWQLMEIPSTAGQRSSYGHFALVFGF